MTGEKLAAGLSTSRRRWRPSTWTPARSACVRDDGAPWGPPAALVGHEGRMLPDVHVPAERARSAAGSAGGVSGSSAGDATVPGDAAGSQHPRPRVRRRPRPIRPLVAEAVDRASAASGPHGGGDDAKGPRGSAGWWRPRRCVGGSTKPRVGRSSATGATGSRRWGRCTFPAGCRCWTSCTCWCICMRRRRRPIGIKARAADSACGGCMSACCGRPGPDRLAQVLAMLREQLERSGSAVATSRPAKDPRKIVASALAYVHEQRRPDGVPAVSSRRDFP